MKIDRSKLFFIASLCLACFGYGASAVHFHVFPYKFLQQAGRAWQAMTVQEYGDFDFEIKDVKGLSRSTVRQFSEAAGKELILVPGGDGFLSEHSPDHGCLAWIMDRQGTVKHVWPFDPGVWENLEKVTAGPGKVAEIYPSGMHLYPNGDLLVSFAGANTFPPAVGIARFDKDSKVLWKKELLAHHWLTVGPDGRIYTPTRRVIDTPYKVGETRFSISFPDGKMYYDAVTILDGDGNVLDEIPLLEALINSGWAGLLSTQFPGTTGKTNDERFTITAIDPAHLNAVQVVDASLAADHPWLSEGDLMVSMCLMNTVGILDPRTRRFKWMSTGAAIAQHSPRFYKDGVLLLDNRGGPAATGGSQLVRIDLETRLPQVLFPRPSVALPGDFYTSYIGQLEMSGGDRVLVSLTIAQKIWEIDVKTGEVLWEYICVDPQQHRRRRIQTAQYVRDVNFPLNRAGEETP